MSNAVKTSRNLLRILDIVVAEFGNDSECADLIRDYMEQPWYAMTEQERKDFFAKGVSEDALAGQVSS